MLGRGKRGPNVHGSKCHRGKMSPWTFQVGLNVTVDKTWVDVTSRHRRLDLVQLRHSSRKILLLQT
jgi:hypothetical protein